MHWKDKMKYAIEIVLNDAIPDRPYEIYFISDSIYVLTYKKHQIFKSEHAENLNSHWRNEVEMICVLLVKNRVALTLEVIKKGPEETEPLNQLN